MRSYFEEEEEEVEEWKKPRSSLHTPCGPANKVPPPAPRLPVPVCVFELPVKIYKKKKLPSNTAKTGAASFSILLGGGGSALFLSLNFFRICRFRFRLIFFPVVFDFLLLLAPAAKKNEPQNPII
jgi:hypothetical protein